MLSKKEAIIIKHIVENKGYITSKELAKILDVSSKTINRLILSINDILKQYNLNITSYRGLGYDICGKKQDINKIIQIAKECIYGASSVDSTENRINNIISMLINNEYISIDIISQNLNLSTTSTTKLLSKVKYIISKYNLSINSKPCYGSYIKGDEKKIRLLIMDYLIDIREGKKIKVDLKNISNKEISLLECIILNNLKKNNLIISDKDFDLLLAKFIISISRSKNKKYITIDKKSQTDNYDMIFNIFTQINTALDLDINDYEIHYILNYTNVILSTYNKNINITDKNIYNTIISALEDITIISGNDYTKDTVFIESIKHHTKRMLNRVFQDIKILNPLINQIKNNLIIEFNLAVFLAKKLEEEFKISIDENELAYIAIHFAVASEKLKKQNTKNICIICNYGIGTGQLLAEKISQNMKNINIIGVYPLRYIQSIPINDIDLIVSTTPIKDIKKQVIYIDNIFSESVINYIENKLNENENKKEILKKMICEDAFFILNLNKKEEIIQTITNNLLSKNYISEKSIKKIIEREKISSTELGNLVSIPHTIMDDNKKSIISITILKNPIVWDKRQVQLIVMIFLSKNDKNNSGVFRHLYNLFKNEEDVKSIINISSFEKLTEILTT